ncbi:hypothetical protein [Paenibacillus sp. AR247]|uniref:hypothetical protein n=1 Tax=Paenibacillus sp. AR247 TaxID=1631599 RepID=UPI0011B01707|nr:hypothetical protein [Paenibacillus sp. AR247]
MCIGGEYDGQILQKRADLFLSFESKPFVANNTCRVYDLLDDFADHFVNRFRNSELAAIVTPDGLMHGFKGMVNPKERVRTLLSKNGECIAVLCELSVSVATGDTISFSSFLRFF